jgi:hypothetical protein
MKAGRNEMISDRAFWIGLTVYAVLFIGAVTAFADSAGNTNLNRSGSVIFGGVTKVETTAIDSLNFWQRPGAVTLSPNGSKGSAITANRITSNALRADLISSELPCSTLQLVNSTSGSRQTFLGANAEGITAQQLAFGDQDLITGDITPVPEAPTWWVAILAASFVGWSQRRRVVTKPSP